MANKIDVVGDGPDTALARLLHTSGRLPLPELQAVLHAARGRRPGGGSLVELLVARGLMTQQELEERWLPQVAGRRFPQSGGETTDVPRHVGPYRVLSELGRGGMGLVYKAHDPRLDREVAIKQILGEQGAEELLRFKREAELTAKLRHPAIATVFEVVTQGPDSPYLVMAYVAGTPLKELCQQGPLPGRRAAQVVLGVARAVASAHEQGIVHRDLKPNNVMITPGGEPVVLDFGLARRVQDESLALTKTGDVVGTPAYMAPEQVEALGPVGPLADVYGVGAVLYECLTGVPPFAGASVFHVLSAVLSRAPTPPAELNPKIHRDLETICLKCLEKNPQQRYPSAEALGEELSRFLAGEPIVARPRGRLARTWHRLRQSKLVVVLTSLVVLGVIGSGVFAWREQRAGQGQRAAEAEAERLKKDRRVALRDGLLALGRITACMERRYWPLLDEAGEARLQATNREVFERALADLDRAIARAPDLSDLHVLKGQVYLATYDYERVITFAERAIELDERSGSAWRLKGRALVARLCLSSFMVERDPAKERRSASEASDCYRRSRELGIELDALGRVWKSVVEARAHTDPLRRRAAISKARRLRSDLRAEIPPEQFHYLGVLLGGSDAEVRRQFNAAIRACPRFFPAILIRSVWRAEKRDLAGAVRDGVLAVRLRPESAPAHFVLAQARLALGDNERALAGFSEAIRLQADYSFAYVSRGAVRRRIYDLPAAIADYTRAILLRPRSYAAHLNRGVARRAQGDVEGALADYAQAIRIDPGKVSAYLNRARLEQAQGDRKGALRDASKAIELDPRCAEAHDLRGAIRARSGQLREAVVDFSAAIRLQAKNVSYYRNRALAKKLLRDFTGALADWTQIIRLQPKASSYIQRASLLEALGRRKEAALDLEQSLRLHPKHLKATKMRALIREWLGRPSKY